ncbi:MAG: AI-2E family transporter [Haloferacaceae archaeon]
MALPEVDRGRAGWWAFGALLAATVVFVAHAFVGTLVFGVFVYYATRPIYRRLRRVVRPNALAAGVALVVLVFPALLLVSYAGLVVVGEINRYTRNGEVAAALGLDPAVLPDVRSPDALLRTEWSRYLTPEQAVSLLDQAGSAVGILAEVGVFLVHVFVIFAFAFYLLRDDHRLARWGRTRFADDRGVLTAYVRAVDRDFNKIFFGNILNAAITGTIGVIAYSTLNAFAPPEIRVPAAALVGLLAGVASLIPVVGMKLVYVPVALYLAVRSALAGFSGPTAGFVLAFVGVSFVVVDTIPDLVLRPYVSGRSLHVGSVMIAYTLGPLLFGWYGIFLLPMVLVLLVHFARVVLPELLDGRPIQPFAVDPGTTASYGETGGDADGTDVQSADSPPVEN